MPKKDVKIIVLLDGSFRLSVNGEVNADELMDLLNISKWKFKCEISSNGQSEVDIDAIKKAQYNATISNLFKGYYCIAETYAHRFGWEIVDYPEEPLLEVVDDIPESAEVVEGVDMEDLSTEDQKAIEAMFEDGELVEEVPETASTMGLKSEEVITTTPLPEDFPGYADLIACRYLTVESVTEATDEELLSVKGVGPKTLESIRNYNYEV